MNYPVETINFVLGLGTVLVQIASLVLFVALIFQKKSPTFQKVVQFAGGNAIGIGFLVALASVGLSLFYSEVLGFAPCGLCWLQRVFLYPQLIIFAVALKTGDEKNAANYGIALSVIGLVIALYQHMLQMGANELIPCAQTLLAADCAERTLFEFGYITFPLMAASVFVFLIALLFALRKRQA